MELYVIDNPDLYNYLLENKADIETTSSLSFDWRELPDRKASRIVLKKLFNLEIKISGRLNLNGCCDD